MPDNTPAPSKLDDLLAAYIRARDAGETPDRVKIIADNPEYAAELAEFFSDNARFENHSAPLHPETLPTRVAGEPANTLIGPITPLSPPPKTPVALPDFPGYEIIREISRGGMGVVYEARQKDLNRKVALKTILAKDVGDEQAVLRFKIEREAVARLDHANIVPIYDTGEHDGKHFFSMKLLEGGSLSGQIPRLVKDPRAAAELLAKVARAIHAAHQRGILHRDLKPGNILLDPKGTPFVTDFGLAKRVEKAEGEISLTAVNAAVGTPQYMSPEQALGTKDLTTSTDVYALGAILYTLLTGAPPFTGDNTMEILLKVLKEEPPAPTKPNGRVDRDLATISLKCLEKDPAKRYASADALAEELERWLCGESITARRASSFERFWRWCRRNSAVAGLAAAAFLILAMGVGVSSYYAREAGAQAKQKGEQLVKTQEALTESRHQEGISWLERANIQANRNNHFAAALMAARAIGFNGVGRPKDNALFERQNTSQLKRESDEWRVATDCIDRIAGAPIWQSVKLKGKIRSVAFTPDGSNIVSKSWFDGGTVQLWDVSTGKEKNKLEGGSNGLCNVCISPDGLFLASQSQKSGFDNIGVWNIGTGEIIAELKGHTDVVFCVCFSPDGATLASGSFDGTVRLWDLATAKEKFKLDGQIDDVSSVCFSPDGGTLVHGSHDNTVRLWDVNTGKMKAKFSGHKGRVYCNVFSPDGETLASGSDDRTLRLWDVPTGKEYAKLEGHMGPIYCPITCLSFSPDGTTLASGGSDSRICLWHVSRKGNWGEPRLVYEAAKLEGHTEDVNSVSFSPDGSTLASGSDDGTVRLWAVASVKEMAQLSDDTKAERFSPDGATLATIGGTTVRLWDVATGKEKAKLEGHSESVEVVSFSPDGATLASGSWDKTVRLWDVAKGKEKGKLDGHTNCVLSVNFSPDGATLASGGFDDTVRLWDAVSGKEKAKFEGLGAVSSVSFSPDGATLASGSWDYTVRLWDVGKGKEKGKLDGHTDKVLSVNFSPDGAMLASGSLDKTVRLWDAATGKCIATYSESSLQIPFWYRSKILVSHRNITAIANGIFDTSIPLDLAAYLPYFEITRDGLKPIDHPEGMPYLNVNPYSHIGILRSGKPQPEIDRLLFWRYYQAMNKNSAGLMLKRVLAGPLDQKIKDEAQDAFDRRFGGKK